MKRRELLITAAAVVAASSTAVADESPAEHHHDAGGSRLLDTALECVKRGELCEAHCFKLLGEGDKSLATCARSVSAMRSVCGALAVLAAQQPPLLPRFAGVAKDFCRACEDECRKHEDKHAVCKACAEACASCGQECAKIAV